MKLRAKDFKANEIIKIIREWTELTQENFGASMNLSARTVQDYESGNTKVSLDRFLELCKMHNIEIEIYKS